jgi:hypothetical protein
MWSLADLTQSKVEVEMKTKIVKASEVADDWRAETHCQTKPSPEEQPYCEGCERMIDKGIDGNCPICDAEHFFAEEDNEAD